MYLGKVVGRIVATRKDEQLVGSKILVVRPVYMDGTPKDGHTIAIDTVGAGSGETVLVISGSSARMTKAFANKPIDSAIVAIVDEVQLDEGEDGGV